jgi:hypothetical protein
MRRDDIRKWAENQRAASARELAEIRNRPMSTAEAFAAAMALLTFDERLNGSPFERPDPVTEREDREMWEAWATLRKRWRNDR